MTESWCPFATGVARGQWPVAVVWLVLMLIQVGSVYDNPLTPRATVMTCCRSACTLQHACCCGLATCSSAGRSHAQLQ